MKSFVKVFCKTMLGRVIIFGMQVDNDVLYRGIAFSCLFFPIYVRFSFFFFHTLNDAIFRQRFL